MYILRIRLRKFRTPLVTRVTGGIKLTLRAAGPCVMGESVPCGAGGGGRGAGGGGRGAGGGGRSGAGAGGGGRGAGGGGRSGAGAGGHTAKFPIKSSGFAIWATLLYS